LRCENEELLAVPEASIFIRTALGDFSRFNRCLKGILSPDDRSNDELQAMDVVLSTLVLALPPKTQRLLAGLSSHQGERFLNQSIRFRLLETATALLRSVSETSEPKFREVLDMSTVRGWSDDEKFSVTTWDDRDPRVEHNTIHDIHRNRFDPHWDLLKTYQKWGAIHVPSTNVSKYPTDAGSISLMVTGTHRKSRASPLKRLSIGLTFVGNFECCFIVTCPELFRVIHVLDCNSR
jgi:hypothetical protein